METLKVFGFGILMTAALLLAAYIGQSRLPESDLCQINYSMDMKWEPVGWSVKDGFPRNDCELMTDRFTYEDGTWEWK